MRLRVLVWAVLAWGSLGLSQEHRVATTSGSEFEIGRHTFFDFGPPFDFYEIFLVRPIPDGTSIERLTLTPAGNACIQPAKFEVASASVRDSISTLLGSNPCKISKKSMAREMKRKRKALVFSGADVAMRMQCGRETRVLRSEVLDRDMFDAVPNTPEHTSWTMQLLSRLENAVGPGPMEKPIFSSPEKEEPSADNSNAEIVQQVNSGRFDGLFVGSPHKPSELYRDSQIRPPSPSVRLLSSVPFSPELLIEPKYPPIARLARIEGTVVFNVKIDAEGNTSNFELLSGHPMLREAVKTAVNDWKFPKGAAMRQTRGAIEFKSNCPADRK